MPSDEATATGGGTETDDRPGKRVNVGDSLSKHPSFKTPSHDSKPSSFKRRTGDDSRPTSRGPSLRPEDGAHTEAETPCTTRRASRIGELPALRLEKKFSKGKSFRKNLVADYSETPEDLERIKRKSKAVAQQVIFKTVQDKLGVTTEMGDMKGLLRDVALEVASEAVVRGGWDNEVAAFIKKRMERRQQSITGGKWHCIVGPDFGSYVTHERGHFCYFYLPRKLSPIEALEKARCERKEREKQTRQQANPTPTPTSASASASAGNNLESGKSTEDVLESKLESEMKQRASQAGLSEESAAPHAAHPMFDLSRHSSSCATLGKEGEDRLWVGILLWRT